MQEFRNSDGETHKVYTSLNRGKTRSRNITVRAAGGQQLIRQIFIGRNDLCPCNSGKKFKKCCIDKVDIYK